MSASPARASNVLVLSARLRQPAGPGREWRQNPGDRHGHGGGSAPGDPWVGAPENAPDLDLDLDLDHDLDTEAPGGADVEPRGDALACEGLDDDEAALAEAPQPGPRPPGARALPGRAGGLPDEADDARLAQWIDRIAHQDAQALEALYDATAARVHGLVRRLTQRDALAEEVLEETYWQAWREAPRFDAARGRPITWLLSMARSRAIDTLRREGRFRHEPLPEDGDDPAGTWADAAAPAPQDLLEATRGHAHVHAALASLEPRARQLVALAFFRGLTHEEIAQQQGLPLGTVKSLIRRALQQLRRVMEASHG